MSFYKLRYPYHTVTKISFIRTTGTIRKCTFIFFWLCCFQSLNAQVSLTGNSYQQDFNSYTGTSASFASQLPGWTASFTVTGLYNGISNGSIATGASYAYGIVGSGEYALGALRTVFTGNITYGVSFTNNTGSVITTLLLSWDYEQWRFLNSSGFNCSGTGALAGTAVDSKDIAGISSGTTGTVNVTPVATFVLTGLNIGIGETFGINWVTTDIVGVDNGVAIDNFSLTIPPPCTNPSVQADVNPSAQSVCQGTDAHIKITAGGTNPLFQWYSNSTNSNSGGISLGSANGAQTDSLIVPTGTPGTFYYYCVVSGCYVQTVSSAAQVTVTAPGTATIAYPGSPFCSSEGIQLVSRTGTAGGTFSSTAGLNIQSNTGAINPASSLPGTYNIIYTLPLSGTCPVQTASTIVTISAPSSASISYPGNPFCSNEGAGSVVLTGTVGGTFSATPSGLNIDPTTGMIQPGSSTPGTYTISYALPANGGCSGFTTTTSISITAAASATIQYNGTPFCSNDLSIKTVIQSGATGGTFSATPGGLSINGSNGDINIIGSIAGTYTVAYNLPAIGGCAPQVFTTVVPINPVPTIGGINLSPSGNILVGATATASSSTAGGTWSSNNAGIASINAAGTVTGVTEGTTLIAYTVTSSGCSNQVASAINVLSVSGSSMWNNPITGPGPSQSNPYTAGQVVNPNISVSGIGYVGVNAEPNAANRYNTKYWNLTSTIDLTKYLYFTITPDPGFAIDFTSFTFTSQVSSAVAPNTVVVRSSMDGYTSDLGSPGITGGTIPLSAAAFQNVTGPISFRVYTSGATNSTATFSINDFDFAGKVRVQCTTPNTIEFQTQPITAAQDVAIPVVVRAFCNSGSQLTGAGFNGPVVLKVKNGCGYVTQTVNAVNGVATFNNVVFKRSPQTGVQLEAFANGFAPIISNSFNITIPAGGMPATDILAKENFEAANTWAYAVGTAIPVGTGGSAGTDVVTIKTFNANKSLVKSYSVDNLSGESGSRNTITFANKNIASTYSNASFSFKLASLGTGGVGSSAGNDTGEDLLIEISLDGGTVWEKLLTYTGNGNYLFPFSSTPVTTLAYNANVKYFSPTALSSFQVNLPTGTTQFRFRLTATNNRTNENWSIDDIQLTGTRVNAPGQVNPLPTVTDQVVSACPSNPTTLTVVTSNTIGLVSYEWSPNSYINNTAVSNPVVNPPTGTTYQVKITDAQGCSATGQVAVNMPGGTVGTWTGVNNSDWFDCSNWGAGVLPSSTTNVVIDGSALQGAEIDVLSSNALAVGGIAQANNLLISSNTLRLQSNSQIHVNGNFDILNNGLLDMTNGGLFKLLGIWYNDVGPTGFKSGIGEVEYASAFLQNIAPENYFNLTSTGTGTRFLPAGYVGIGGYFNIGFNSYTVSTSSTVHYNGNGWQQIAVLPFRNLQLSNTGSKSLGGNTELNGLLTLQGNASLRLNDYHLNLLSTATQTAAVATITSSANPLIEYNGTGRFVVERYYPARRAWRLITAPVTVDASKTFFHSWQTGGANLPGSGTYITGNNGVWTGAASGLDFSPLNNNSLKLYNNSTGNYTNVANTKTLKISGTAGIPGVPDNIGFFMFVRGDRTPTNFDVSSVNNTTLRDTGKIQTGSYTFNLNGPAGGYALLGNPYAASIDLGTALLGASGINTLNFYLYDPNLGTSNGGYLTMTKVGSVYQSVPASPSQFNQLVRSSQAFFVQRNSPFASITIQESHKETATNINTIFRPVPSSMPRTIRANLYKTVSGSGGQVLADGNLVKFEADKNAGIDEEDARKFTNINENFGLKRADQMLSVETRPLIANRDTLFYQINRTAPNTMYELEILGNQFQGDNLKAVLEDALLQTKTRIDLNGQTRIPFAVQSGNGSSAADRFRLLLQPAVQFAPVVLKAEQNDVELQWTVQEESDIRNYVIERSNDGKAFESIQQLFPSNNRGGDASYRFQDVALPVGHYWYRINAVDLYNNSFYTETKQVQLVRYMPGFSVFPNPVQQGRIHLRIAEQPVGTYQLELTDATGKQMAFTSIHTTANEQWYDWKLVSGLKTGVYILSIKDQNGKTSTLKLLAE